MQYYTWTNADGTVLAIARADGPTMQLLSAAGQWQDWPALITSLQEPDKYKPVSEQAAQAAAARDGIAWPS